jgi:hypothetical protein
MDASLPIHARAVEKLRRRAEEAQRYGDTDTRNLYEDLSTVIESPPWNICERERDLLARDIAENHWTMVASGLMSRRWGKPLLAARVMMHFGLIAGKVEV